MKVNLLKVLNIQTRQSEERKIEQVCPARFYFLITNQYYNETNKAATEYNYSCNQYFPYNSCHKYPLKYQSKYLAHFTVFTEYYYKTTSKSILTRKVLL